MSTTANQSAANLSPNVNRENFLPWMADQKEPITISENGPPSYPPHQHYQRNDQGNQQEPVGGFPNQNVGNGHCGVGFRIF
jgi:hypothetical protein